AFGCLLCFPSGAMRTTGKQCGLAATGVYQPSLRSPWLAANEKKQKQQEAAQEKKQKAEKCKVARSNLKSMQEKPPNTLWGLPDGSYQRFTVEERQKEIDKLNKIINENCK
ncbi:hypothetical protein, partial [Thiolapillus sp.]